MRQSILWRAALALAVLLLSTAYLLPSLPFFQRTPISDKLPEARLSLGLDLVGGIYVALGVDVDKAVENSLVQIGQELRRISREESILVTRPLPRKNDLTFVLPDKTKLAALDKLLNEQFAQITFSHQELPDGSVHYTAGYSEEQRGIMEEQALEMALKTIRNRIDQFGVAEPDIRKQSAEKRIIIQLPGLKDPERAVQIIGKTAHLEFHMRHELSDQEQERLTRGILPSGTMSLPVLGKDASGQSSMLVDREAVFTGEYIEDASQDRDQNGRPSVGIRFNRRGAVLFERITGENVGKNLAIVLDGNVYSAPTIQERIGQGRASITGSFTAEEAQDLALVLRAGSLPAPVSVMEERTVGPSLGQESIEKGIRSALIGWSVIMLFIVVYYSLSGVIAVSMLLFDIALILAGMAAFGATLTLPGIAGIVLTMGMAVDANVLIYERIREELHKGAAPATAVDLGFSRATLTIADSNITTIIAAIILYEFGTGPVRGFAVTLTLGILASMFTAIFVSRIIFDLWITKKSAKISI
jgi:preprotein translocase subunit SecD